MCVCVLFCYINIYNCFRNPAKSIFGRGNKHKTSKDSNGGNGSDSEHQQHNSNNNDTTPEGKRRNSFRYRGAGTRKEEGVRKGIEGYEKKETAWEGETERQRRVERRNSHAQLSLFFLFCFVAS